MRDEHPAPMLEDAPTVPRPAIRAPLILVVRFLLLGAPSDFEMLQVPAVGHTVDLGTGGKVLYVQSVTWTPLSPDHDAVVVLR